MGTRVFAGGPEQACSGHLPACPALTFWGALQVGQSKPAPDIFLLALEQLIQRQEGRAPVGAQIKQQHQLLAETCLVFEDAPSGVEAGLAAGMQVGGRVADIVEDSLRLGTC